MRESACCCCCGVVVVALFVLLWLSLLHLLRLQVLYCCCRCCRCYSLLGLHAIATFSFSLAASFALFLLLRAVPSGGAEVTGKFSSVVDKIKIGGPFVLYNGSIAAAGATFVGHYP